MIPNTLAFLRLKEQIRDTFNFAIVVCHAVPSLKQALKTVAPGEELPFTPDFFDDRPIPMARVREDLKQYKEVLSRQIFLSSFSCFEAYFLDVLKEIVDFHGKENLLGKVTISKNLALNDPDSISQKRKLQEYRTGKHNDAYKTYGSKLASKGFLFPSALLARFGIEQLLNTLDEENIKAVQIPGYIESILQLPLDEDEKDTFNSYRQMRNKIAHGRPEATAFHLQKAAEANNFLRNLALKIDHHVVDNFFVVET